MRKHLIVVALVATITGAVVVSGAAGQVVTPTEPEPTVRVERPAKHKTIHRNNWEPWGNPVTDRQVHIIIQEERKRFPASGSIEARIHCESGGHNENASNGIYKGLIQAEDYIWGYMWATTPRGVKYVTTDTRKRPVMQITTWPDGKVSRKQVGVVNQRLKIVRTGRLPRNPGQYHAWAAVRVGQRALPGGGGRSTSWACGA